jgi:hypothetical protein
LNLGRVDLQRPERGARALGAALRLHQHALGARKPLHERLERAARLLGHELERVELRHRPPKPLREFIEPIAGVHRLGELLLEDVEGLGRHLDHRGADRGGHTDRGGRQPPGGRLGVGHRLLLVLVRLDLVGQRFHELQVVALQARLLRAIDRELRAVHAERGGLVLELLDQALLLLGERALHGLHLLRALLEAAHRLGALLQALAELVDLLGVERDAGGRLYRTIELNDDADLFERVSHLRPR